MFKLFLGIILFYFCLSDAIIEPYNSSIAFPIIPAVPIRNENWNEYIVLSGNNFVTNYYKNTNYTDIKI